ncbi:hypothetical protein LguiA_027930 [Lonicera macranthoides]
MDPTLINEILTKNNIFKKTAPNLDVTGLYNYGDEKWAKHRKIVTPAFYLYKLKVTMILIEVLRLYPPGALIMGTVYKETKLGDMILPWGVQFLLLIILVNHDTEIGGEDAKELKPEKFAGVAKASKNQVSCFPFSWGPRTCMGHNFAMMEAKLVFPMILHHLSFQLSSSYTHAPFYIATLKPQHGAYLVLRKIILWILIIVMDYGFHNCLFKRRSIGDRTNT